LGASRGARPDIKRALNSEYALTGRVSMIDLYREGGLGVREGFLSNGPGFRGSRRDQARACRGEV